MTSAASDASVTESSNFFFRNTAHKAQVGLRFCPWLLLFNYYTSGPDLSFSLCISHIRISGDGKCVRDSFF